MGTLTSLIPSTPASPRFPASILTDIHHTLMQATPDTPAPLIPDAARIREYACVPDKLRNAGRKGKIKTTFKRMLKSERMQTDRPVDKALTPRRPDDRPVYARVDPSNVEEDSTHAEDLSPMHAVSSLEVSPDSSLPPSLDPDGVTIEILHAKDPSRVRLRRPVITRAHRVAERIKESLHAALLRRWSGHRWLAPTRWQVTGVDVLGRDMGRAVVYWLPLVASTDENVYEQQTVGWCCCFVG